MLFFLHVIAFILTQTQPVLATAFEEATDRMGSGGSKKSADKAAEKPETKPAEPAAGYEAGKDAKAEAAPAAPAAAPAAAAEASPAAAPLEVPTDDAVYKIVDPPEDFVVEGLKLAGGVLSDHPDVREGKVLQVAKHPEEHMMQYWLKVEYSGQIAFVRTLMSCGWNSSHVIRGVGDAQFPPDPKNLPVSAEVAPAPAPAAPEEGPTDDAVYKIVDPPEDFVVQGLQSCGGIVADSEVKHGKVVQVAKHPHEPRMHYWLKVEYGSSQVALVHMLMSCGWTSDQLLLDVGDVAFPPDPKNLPTSGGGDKPLPDLKPADYAQEFVDPSHQEAIATNESLKATFPEASVGQVRSMWRGPTGIWVEVTGEPGNTRYGAHFLEPEDQPHEEGQPYVMNCAVRLAEEEEFPPEPKAAKGKAVAF